MSSLPASELVLNPDGSIYHLQLLPDDIAHKIILVGDPDRVSEVSNYFDSIEIKKSKREFHTHTGYYKKHRITVLSTGIGTDNIDIVINELDALVNIDFETRLEHNNKISLEIYRIGTTGTIQDYIDIDSILISKYAIGMDNMMLYYDFFPKDIPQNLMDNLTDYLFENGVGFITPYVFEASSILLDKFNEYEQGITATHNGFYGPQGRMIRARPIIKDYIKLMSQYQSQYGQITNFEMETAGIYGLSTMLGHKAISINVVLAHRVKGIFSSNYSSKMNETIQMVLDKIIG